MINNSPQTLLLLLEDGALIKGNVRMWLTNSGFVTWEAKDVCHALEEFSDFTVKRRPDVVLLEVPALPECFDTFRSTFEISADGNEFSVLALSNTEPSDESRPYVAGDLNQLKAIMRGSSVRPSALAV
jgi:hypothetical protein